MENNRPKAVARCKKHPKHQQSPGVCSVCLRERLSKLSTTSSRSSKITTNDSSSSCSSLSSLSSSESSTPVYHRYCLASEAKNANTVLKKSRSLAFVARKEGEGRDGKKKSGFWSKLVRYKSEKKMDEVHSRSNMNERVISTRILH